MSRSQPENLPTSSDKTKSSLPIKVLILGNKLPKAIASRLTKAGFQVDWQPAATQAQYKDRLKSQLDLILYDTHSTQITLSEAISLLSESDLTIPLLVINGASDVSAAVAAIKAGASDYLSCEELNQLPQAIAKALAKRSLPSFEPHSIAETRQQLQKLITENVDGILVVNEGGIVQFVNPAALQLLGKSSAELIGESFGFPVVNGDYLEVDIPLSPDKILVAQMRLSQIQWQGANAYLVCLRDITQLKQAEEERGKLLEEAQAANRAKDEFLAILSHELRTPLNSIVGWSQLLATGRLSEAQIKKGVETIQRNAILQTKLIEDILNISRIIRGKLKLQACPLHLSTIINDALDTVNLAALAKSIQIKTNLNQNVGLVQGDPTRLQQVVWNLLSNAVKFTPPGGEVEISLATVKAPIQNYDSPQISNREVSQAQIQVTDTGKGIESQFLPYVFDYFRQIEGGKNRAEGGLGLGLAIVRHLVELHGGTITVTSPGVGKGATFTLLLPIVESLNVSAQKNSLPGGLKNLERIKILVVEDDDSSRDLLNFLLINEGAETKITTSATEALAVMEQFQPHILISDIGMPYINGYELIQKVRNLSSAQGKNLTAIALTAYATDEDRQQALEAGFDLHLSKPIEPLKLIEYLAQLTSNQKDQSFNS